jgi:hypothetical protein
MTVDRSSEEDRVNQYMNDLCGGKDAVTSSLGASDFGRFYHDIMSEKA